MITREGEGVTGAIFPTGARRWPWISRWACRSASWRPDGLCLMIADCRLTGREFEGTRRTRWETGRLPGGSVRAEALGLGPCFAFLRAAVAGDCASPVAGGITSAGRVSLPLLQKLVWGVGLGLHWETLWMPFCFHVVSAQNFKSPVRPSLCVCSRQFVCR